MHTGMLSCTEFTITIGNMQTHWPAPVKGWQYKKFLTKKSLVMATYEKATEVLNDLVKINNDRVEGYEKAIVQTNEADLKALFTQMADESRKYVMELNQQLGNWGKEVQTETTASGKIYRTWMDVKRTFTGNDRHAILSSCEYGEDAAQRAYAEALGTEEPLPNELRELITRQKASLKRSHDIIKQQRDLEKVNS